MQQTRQVHWRRNPEKKLHRLNSESHQQPRTHAKPYRNNRRSPRRPLHALNHARQRQVSRHEPQIRKIPRVQLLLRRRRLAPIPGLDGKVAFRNAAQHWINCPSGSFWLFQHDAVFAAAPSRDALFPEPFHDSALQPPADSMETGANPMACATHAQWSARWQFFEPGQLLGFSMVS